MDCPKLTKLPFENELKSLGYWADHNDSHIGAAAQKMAPVTSPRGFRSLRYATHNRREVWKLGARRYKETVRRSVGSYRDAVCPLKSFPAGQLDINDHHIPAIFQVVCLEKSTEWHTSLKQIAGSVFNIKYIRYSSSILFISFPHSRFPITFWDYA